MDVDAVGTKHEQLETGHAPGGGIVRDGHRGLEVAGGRRVEDDLRLATPALVASRRSRTCYPIDDPSPK